MMGMIRSGGVGGERRRERRERRKAGEVREGWRGGEWRCGDVEVEALFCSLPHEDYHFLVRHLSEYCTKYKCKVLTLEL